MPAALTVMVIVSLPGLVLLLFALAVIDRVGHAANSSRLRLPWRKAADGRPLAATGFEELQSLYASSKRHEVDQRQSSLVMRDEEGDNRLDLDAGTAVIRTVRTTPAPARRSPPRTRE
ncbi:DUF6191 domain-containing protein [Actinomadura rugatobispora]|uniref:DUF6191 domain-containing protein n=1 Tax=Actinomadura rugatobispora TaxID=1994 RepID=A0ABW1A5P3_9ACTN|nr:hypothetical protein GCM10010200_041450 [Actinomadura rugatobispora]